MSSQGGYKLVFEAMKAGIITKKLFSPVKAELKYQLLQRVNPETASMVNRAKTDNELYDIVSRLQIDTRKKIIRGVKSRFGFSYPNSSYMPVISEVEGYDFTKIDVPGGELRNGKTTDFGYNFSFNSHYTFLGSQFLKIVTEKPVIADPSKVPNGYVVRYWYTSKPGVRLINRIGAYSDISEFDNYNQLDVLKYENDSLNDNIYEIWNELIGNDLGTEAKIYNSALETTEVRTVKVGYQTGKLEQDPLSVYIPLLFAHNRNLNDKINLSSFNKKTINLKGLLEKNELIVRAAAFNLTDPSETPVLLDVAPLKIKECGVYSLLTALDDMMITLNLGNYYNNLFSRTKSDRYEVKSSVKDIKLVDRSESLQLAVMARPKWYSTDFDLWTEFTPVQKFCYPTPIAIPDIVNGGYKLVIQGAEYLKPISAFKSINLFNDGVCIMADGTKDGNGDPRLWSQVDVYSKSYRYLNYRVRKQGIIYFNFNPHVNTKKISCVYNFAKLDSSVLHVEFNSDVGFTFNGDLGEPYELVAFSDALNEHLTSGNSLTRVIIN